LILLIHSRKKRADKAKAKAALSAHIPECKLQVLGVLDLLQYYRDEIGRHKEPAAAQSLRSMPAGSLGFPLFHESKTRRPPDVDVAVGQLVLIYGDQDEQQEVASKSYFWLGKIKRITESDFMVLWMANSGVGTWHFTTGEI